MSNRAQRRHPGGLGAPRQLRPPRVKAHGDYATLLGWCATEADLPAARQATHDGLIRMLGANRRSGVEWRQWDGDKAVAVVDKALAEPSSPEAANHYRQIRGLLRERGGWVVMALAEGKR